MIGSPISPLRPRVSRYHTPIRSRTQNFIPNLRRSTSLSSVTHLIGASPEILETPERTETDAAANNFGVARTPRAPRASTRILTPLPSRFAENLFGGTLSSETPERIQGADTTSTQVNEEHPAQQSASRASVSMCDSTVIKDAEETTTTSFEVVKSEGNKDPFECCICFEHPINDNIASINGCNHNFCFDCIERSSRRPANGNHCPLCRTPFDTISSRDGRRSVHVEQDPLERIPRVELLDIFLRLRRIQRLLREDGHAQVAQEVDDLASSFGPQIRLIFEEYERINAETNSVNEELISVGEEIINANEGLAQSGEAMINVIEERQP